mmetsp:Transcript_141025/g.245815  ORF Transcript_141025/g.245815 Transcript_141025/m.245815 type:complete len:143 (-) Transcript_141025:312-740(-)
MTSVLQHTVDNWAGMHYRPTPPDSVVHGRGDYTSGRVIIQSPGPSSFVAFDRQREQLNTNRLLRHDTIEGCESRKQQTVSSSGDDCKCFKIGMYIPFRHPVLRLLPTPSPSKQQIKLCICNHCRSVLIDTNSSSTPRVMTSS